MPAPPPKRRRSGEKVTRVKSRTPGGSGATAGSPRRCMLSRHVWRYSRPREPSAVSTVNSVLKMFTSFAP